MDEIPNIEKQPNFSPSPLQPSLLQHHDFLNQTKGVWGIHVCPFSEGWSFSEKKVINVGKVAMPCMGISLAWYKQEDRYKYPGVCAKSYRVP